MKNLFLGILVVVLAGCKLQKFTDFPPPIEVEKLLENAWNRYDNGNIDGALTTFDSVIVRDASLIEALSGKGWVYLQKNDYNNALAYFSLATAGEAISLIKRVFKEQLYGSQIDTSGPFPYGTSWAVPVENTGILGVTKITLNIAEPLTPKYFDDTLIYFDTSVPADSDSIQINYVIYQPSVVSSPFKWAYAGIGLANLADEEDVESAIYLGALLRRDNSFYFPHWPYVNASNIYGALGYSFFRQGLYGNCVDALKEAGWQNPPSDPFNSDAFPVILKRIEFLMNQ